jgi:hypothetical protein
MHSPSGLEVNHQCQHFELEPNKQAAVYPDQGPEFHDPMAKASNSNDVHVHHDHVPRVCGLMSRRMFWMSVAAVVIILTTTAALGGGLGAIIYRRLSTNLSSDSPQMTGASSTATSSTQYGYIQYGYVEYGYIELGYKYDGRVYT